MSTTNFHPLPDRLPATEASYLLRFMRGQDHRTKPALWAATNLLGYAVAQLPDAEVVSLESEDYRLEPDLEAIAGEDERMDMLAVDWRSLGREIVQLIATRLLFG